MSRGVRRYFCAVPIPMPFGAQDDIDEIDSLFYDAKASAKLLLEQQGICCSRALDNPGGCLLP